LFYKTTIPNHKIKDLKVNMANLLGIDKTLVLSNPRIGEVNGKITYLKS